MAFFFFLMSYIRFTWRVPASGFLTSAKFFVFIYLWLCWVFVSVWGLSPVAASGGHSSTRCAGLSPSQPLSLQSTGSRRAGSAIVAHGPSRSAACGILPDQGSNPCPLHRQADSQPLRHQGSPLNGILKYYSLYWARKEAGKLQPRIGLYLCLRARESDIEGETKAAISCQGIYDSMKSS